MQATKREIPSKDIIAIALNGIPVYGPMASMGMGIVELEKLVTNSAELEPPDLDDKHTAALQGGRGGGGQYWYGKLMWWVTFSPTTSTCIVCIDENV